MEIFVINLRIFNRQKQPILIPRDKEEISIRLHSIRITRIRPRNVSQILTLSTTGLAIYYEYRNSVNFELQNDQPRHRKLI
jgi:hypothetical protein